jgi:hypothetical protein
MPLDSSDINPIEFANDWQNVVIAGTTSPGAIPIDGIHGFERETGWDKKKGKGASGATLTLTQYPPSEGAIDFQLWLPEHFTQWKRFRALLKYNTTKTTNTAADALNIYHPALADVGISQVVTHKVSPARHVGKGLYIISVEFLEWIPPPPVSVVATTTTARGDNKSATPGTPTDPIGDAQQKLIGSLLAQAANTPVG